MVRSVLLECDEQTVVNVKALINRVRVKLIEKYKCFFMQVLDCNSGTRVNTGNKLLTYSKIKINYEREKYTEANIPLAYKKCITSLRISTHKLEIELGRYQKPTPVPANERICKQCCSGCVKDEHHFMFECKKHDQERIILYREYNRKKTDLCELFLNCNEYQLRSIGKYIATCMMKGS